MQIDFSKSDDSKGIWIRSRFVTFSFHYWRIFKNKLGWRFAIQINKGAGYVSGRTGFIAWRSRTRLGRILFKVGFTKNFQKVPYPFR